LDIIEQFILLAYGRTHAGVITAIAISGQGVPEFSLARVLLYESVDLAKSKTDLLDSNPCEVQCLALTVSLDYAADENI
jgi:hypothetical protein